METSQGLAMATGTESARLRVVGQELEQRKATDFEVFVEQDGYRVRAVLPAPPPDVTPQPKRKLTDFFKSKAVPMPVEVDQDPEPWEQTYSRADVDRLDGWYKAMRTRVGAPDDYAISQVLRVVGAFAEQRRWSLVGISRRKQMIEIRHRDNDGDVEMWENKYSDLYDFSAQMFKQRKSPSLAD